MILSAIVAVALGVVPVKDTESRQLVRVDGQIAAGIGRYEQYAGKDGRTHVRGFDGRGRAYDIVIDQNGHVEANVGDHHVSFDVKDAA